MQHTTEVMAGALDELDAALGSAAAVSLSCASRAELSDWLCRLQGLRAKMDSLACAAAAEAANATVQVLSSNRTIESHIAANTSTNPKSISADRVLGQWLIRFPLFAHGFAAGTMTRRHIEALKGVCNSRTQTLLVDAQQYLLDAAATTDWHGFTQVLGYWLIAFDPDGAEPKTQVANRSTSILTDVDGMTCGRFKLDPLAGAALTSALSAEEQRLFREDTTNGVARTATQRRADALVRLVTRGAANPNAATNNPLVHIVLSQHVAEDMLNRLSLPTGGDAPLTALATNPLPLHPQRVDGRCELVDGTPIHPAFAAATLAAAALRRLVLTSDSEIIDLGRSNRLFPKHLRQAIIAANRGRCAVVGCDAPIQWLQADHLIPWGKSGATATSNAQPLCDPHNKVKRDRSPPQPHAAEAT